MINKNIAKNEYENFINNCKNRKICGYKENHHIIPKCMGGKETVILTVKEHVKAHELLMWSTFGTKYHIKMAIAYFNICNTRYFTDKVDFKSLEYARKKHSENMTGRVVSEKTKQKLRIARAKQKPPRPKGFKMSEDHKKKIGDANRDKKNGIN